MSQDRVTTSFRIHKELLRLFKQREPKRGNRSHVLCEMIKQYISGQVKVMKKTY